MGASRYRFSVLKKIATADEDPQIFSHESCQRTASATTHCTLSSRCTTPPPPPSPSDVCCLGMGRAAAAATGASVGAGAGVPCT